MKMRLRYNSDIAWLYLIWRDYCRRWFCSVPLRSHLWSFLNSSAFVHLNRLHEKAAKIWTAMQSGKKTYSSCGRHWTWSNNRVLWNFVGTTPRKNINITIEFASDFPAEFWIHSLLYSQNIFYILKCKWKLFYWQCQFNIRSLFSSKFNDQSS